MGETDRSIQGGQGAASEGGRLELADVALTEDALWIAIGVAAFADDGGAWIDAMERGEREAAEGLTKKSESAQNAEPESAPQAADGPGAPGWGVRRVARKARTEAGTLACEIFVPLSADPALRQEAELAAQAMGEGVRALQKQWPAPAEAGRTVWGGALAANEPSARTWGKWRSWCRMLVTVAIGVAPCGRLDEEASSAEAYEAWRAFRERFGEIAPALREAWRALSRSPEERPLAEQEAYWLGAAARVMIAHSSTEQLRAGLACWPSLAEAGELVDSWAIRRSSLLVEALAAQQIAVAWDALDRSPLEAADERGGTALIHAARIGVSAIVGRIVERCDESHLARVDESGMTAFHWACTRGRKAIAQTLLRPGDLERRDRKGRDALDMMIWSNCEQTLEWLASRWPAEDWAKRRPGLLREALARHQWGAAQWLFGLLDRQELLRHTSWLPEDWRERMPPLAQRIEAARQAEAIQEQVEAANKARDDAAAGSPDAPLSGASRL
jgi:hypothetical protein